MLNGLFKQLVSRDDHHNRRSSNLDCQVPADDHIAVVGSNRNMKRRHSSDGRRRMSLDESWLKKKNASKTLQISDPVLVSSSKLAAEVHVPFKIDENATKSAPLENVFEKARHKSGPTSSKKVHSAVLTENHAVPSENSGRQLHKVHDIPEGELKYRSVPAIERASSFPVMIQKDRSQNPREHNTKEVAGSNLAAKPLRLDASNGWKEVAVERAGHGSSADRSVGSSALARHSSSCDEPSPRKPLECLARDDIASELPLHFGLRSPTSVLGHHAAISDFGSFATSTSSTRDLCSDDISLDSPAASGPEKTSRKEPEGSYYIQGGSFQSVDASVADSADHKQKSEAMAIQQLKAEASWLQSELVATRQLLTSLEVRNYCGSGRTQKHSCNSLLEKQRRAISFPPMSAISTSANDASLLLVEEEMQMASRGALLKSLLSEMEEEMKCINELMRVEQLKNWQLVREPSVPSLLNFVKASGSGPLFASCDHAFSSSPLPATPVLFHPSMEVPHALGLQVLDEKPAMPKGARTSALLPGDAICHSPRPPPGAAPERPYTGRRFHSGSTAVGLLPPESEAAGMGPTGPGKKNVMQRLLYNRNFLHLLQRTPSPRQPAPLHAELAASLELSSAPTRRRRSLDFFRSQQSKGSPAHAVAPETPLDSGMLQERSRLGQSRMLGASTTERRIWALKGIPCGSVPGPHDLSDLECDAQHAGARRGVRHSSAHGHDGPCSGPVQSGSGTARALSRHSMEAKRKGSDGGDRLGTGSTSKGNRISERRKSASYLRIF